MRMRSPKKAFTLTELVIAIIIMGVLFLLFGVKLRQIRQRAIVVEAVAALSAIRTAERTYHVQSGRYTISYNELPLNLRLTFWKTGMPISDLDGTYFSEECYTRGTGIKVSSDGSKFLIYCTPANSTFPSTKCSDARYLSIAFYGGASGAYIAIDQSGKFYSNLPSLGYGEAPQI